MNGIATQGSGGYGPQTPNDGASDYNAMIFAMRQILATIDTMKPVKVVSVTGGGGAVARAGTVDVLPLVQQVDGANNATTYGTVYGIPWWRMQGGDGAVIMDPQVGDYGFVIAADRDITNVKLNPGERTPGSARSFSVCDGIYVGGIINDAPVQYVAFTADGIRIVDRSGNVIQTSSVGLTIVDAVGNQIVTRSGFVNIVTPSFLVNGVPVTVP